MEETTTHTIGQKVLDMSATQDESATLQKGTVKRGTYHTRRSGYEINVMWHRGEPKAILGVLGKPIQAIKQEVSFVFSKTDFTRVIWLLLISCNHGVISCFYHACYHAVLSSKQWWLTFLRLWIQFIPRRLSINQVSVPSVVDLWFCLQPSGKHERYLSIFVDKSAND